MKFEIWYPVKPFVLIQPFGGNPQIYKQFGIKGHNGVDLKAAHGQPVYAAHDGVVVYSGMDGKEGVGVVIRTNQEVEYSLGQKAFMKSIYWHLINNVQVKIGQQVKTGDLIGFADSTGFSTGDHLHFAIKPQAMGENEWTWENIVQNNGYNGAIDPMPYFNGFYATDQKVVINALQTLLGKIKELLALKAIPK